MSRTKHPRPPRQPKPDRRPDLGPRLAEMLDEQHFDPYKRMAECTCEANENAVGSPTPCPVHGDHS